MFDSVSQNSRHKKHKATVQNEAFWNFGENYTLTSNLVYAFDYIDSTEAGQRNRLSLSGSANASLYFFEGLVSLHPSVDIVYLSDLEMLSPNASMGILYSLRKNTEVRGSISYAENSPTFSDLYWPYTDYGWGYTYVGNPNLKPEKGVNADAGLAYTRGNLSYEGMLFGRNIYNAIDASGSMPVNIAHSVYLGTEQSVEISLNNNVSLQASYQYNKSYDLSNGKTFADNIEVSSVRKHTAKGSLFLAYGKIDSALSAEFLGKTSSLDSAFLVNLSVGIQVTEALKAYIAVDNLLNTSYELTSGGYPMPGTKIRLGGKLRF